MMRGLLQSLALERDDPLVARHLAARVDGEGHMALAEQGIARFDSAREPRLVEPRKRAQVRRRVEIDQAAW